MVDHEAAGGRAGVHPAQRGKLVGAIHVVELEQHAGREAAEALVEGDLEGESALSSDQVHLQGHRPPVEAQGEHLQLASAGRACRHLLDEGAVARRVHAFAPLPSSRLQVEELVDPDGGIGARRELFGGETAQLREARALAPELLAPLAGQRAGEKVFRAGRAPQDRARIRLRDQRRPLALVQLLAGRQLLRLEPPEGRPFRFGQPDEGRRRRRRIG